MAEHALLLHPQDPAAAADPDRLREVLGKLGLLAAPLPGEDGTWYGAGPRLLDLVTFLGCSPVIRLAAAGAGDTGFCRARLPPPLPRPACRTGDNLATPRCPRCRTPDPDWCRALPGWQADPGTPGWTCPACGHPAPLHRLGFRDTAGFGRCFVELWGIHPAEAVPGEELLEALAGLGDGPWRWSYWSGPQPGTGR